jgi:phenylalanyl-tRNA synthetase alpha subunit
MIQKQVLANGGLKGHAGWAFGIGIERCRCLLDF